MNTNSNVYTIVYTTVIVVIVAAVLAFAAMSLKPMQTANIKAETLSQMMAAAKLGEKAEISAKSNDEILKMYTDNISEAFTINVDGQKTGELAATDGNIELIDNFKPQDKAIKAGEEATLPVYVFKSGVTVVPIYGAGLWGPIWGYVAFQEDGKTIAGAYFDHESETPGLGAKIKDEPWFREKFIGKTADFGSDRIFYIDKNVEAEHPENAVDAISGATMTSRGLNKAVNVWFKAYAKYFTEKAAAQAAVSEESEPVAETEPATDAETKKVEE